MMERDQAAELLEKYRRGECTPEEERILFQAFNRVPLPPDVPRDDLDHYRLQRETLTGIHRQLDRRRTRRLRRWLPYAAAILLAATVATWFFHGNGVVDPEDSLANQHEIPPGGNRAMLTLADGRIIDLDESQTGIVIGDGITYADGTDITSGDRVPVGEDVNQLTLTTPKGGTYQVTLPDGTHVWVNAETTIRYLDGFAANERIVSVDGEAYFSVASDVRRPFKVVSGAQTIAVLGTEFNLSAYSADQETKTTLVDGSVRIVNGQTRRASTLKPGQQSTVRGTVIETQEIDVQQFTAWKDGYFYFNGDSPQDAFAQLSRWYDIEIAYRGAVPKVEFYGKLERNKPLGSMLNILQKAGLLVEVVGKDGRHQLIIGDN